MADYFCCMGDQQLDLDDLHRLLPREILADIGIGDDEGTTSAAAFVDMEELAERLSGILSPSGASRRRQQQRQPPPPTMAATNQGCRGSIMNRDGELMMMGAACYHYSPVLGTKGVNGGATPFDVQGMQHWARRFAAPAIGTKNASHRPLLLPPAMRHGGSAGTGVFLPRADAYQTRPACSSRQARAGLQRKEVNNNNATMMIKPQRQ